MATFLVAAEYFQPLQKNCGGNIKKLLWWCYLPPKGWKTMATIHVLFLSNLLS